MKSSRQAWRTLDAEAFLSWLDARHRRRFVTVAQRMVRSLSDQEAHEAWARVLIGCWRHGVEGSTFVSEAQLVGWLQSRLRTVLRHMRCEERQRRGMLARLRRGTEVLISEWEAEHYRDGENFLELVPAPQHVPELGPSPGWFDQCLEMLTARQREAVETMIFGGLSGPEAAQVMGLAHRNYPRFHRDQALKKLRKAVAEGVVVPGAA